MQFSPKLIRTLAVILIGHVARISRLHMKRAFTLLICFMLQVSCAKQWREGDTGISDQEFVQKLNEVGSLEDADLDPALADVLAMKDEPGVAIYFAEAPGKMGRMAGVFNQKTLKGIHAMDAGAQVDNANAVTKARVFMFMQTKSKPLRIGFIIGTSVASESELKYQAFHGEGRLSSSAFSVDLLDRTKLPKLRLESNDVRNGDLTSAIQLKVTRLSDLAPLGKFPTLIGYQR